MEGLRRPDPGDAVALREHFAQDGERPDVDAGFRVVFQIAEEVFAQGVALFAPEGEEHRLGEGRCQEGLELREVLFREGGDVLEGGAEAQGAGEFQQEPDVEVGEIAVQAVQGQDAADAPGVQAVLRLPVLDGAQEHLRQEQAHRVLVQVVPDAVQGVFRRQVPGAPEGGFRIRDDVHLQDVQGQEQGHPRFLAHADEEPAPAVRFRKRMHDDRILAELRVAQDDRLDVLRHRLFR